MYNISREVRQYQELFYDKCVMVVIRIYDDAKIWDADNRNNLSRNNKWINDKGEIYLI